MNQKIRLNKATGKLYGDVIGIVLNDIKEDVYIGKFIKRDGEIWFKKSFFLVKIRKSTMEQITKLMKEYEEMLK